jgi:hypothetical protein
VGRKNGKCIVRQSAKEERGEDEERPDEEDEGYTVE